MTPSIMSFFRSSTDSITASSQLPHHEIRSLLLGSCCQKSDCWQLRRWNRHASMELIRTNVCRSSKTLYALNRSLLIFEGHQARFLCDNCVALIISVCWYTDQRVSNTTIQATNAPSELPTASVAGGITIIGWAFSIPHIVTTSTNMRDFSA
jgi:hypothetical protein